MVEDIKNSIKAKLYDFAYTPFMSSVLISWLIFNHKYLLVYFTDFDLDKKLLLLDEYDFTSHFYGYSLPYANNVIFPILFGLFYVFIYPRISKIFYEVTLERTKELKAIKQSIEDETPLTQVEANEIRKLAVILEEEKYKALESLHKKEEEYKIKLDNSIKSYADRTTNLQNDLMSANTTIENLRQDLESQNNAYIKLSEDVVNWEALLSSKDIECEALQIEIDKLKKKIPPIPPKLPLGDINANVVDNDIKLSVAYEKVMQYLHDEFDPMTESDLVDRIVRSTKLGKTLVRHIIHTLRDDKILTNNGSIIVMTKEGTAKVLDYIEKSNNIPF